MFAALLLFPWLPPTGSGGIYGLGALWFQSATPPIVVVASPGCDVCTLYTEFQAGILVNQFKRVRPGMSFTPYCPTCYTYTTRYP